MNFSETINIFVESKQDYRIQAQGYQKDLLVFWDFLKTKNVDDESWPYFLGGANTELIIGSLKYYIRENKINSISTGNRFISVLVEFFQIIIDKEIIQNKELYAEMNSPIYSTKSFRARINSWISQNLKDKESIIKEFTGVGKTVFEDCLNIINKDIHKDRNVFLDSRVRELFSYNNM